MLSIVIPALNEETYLPRLLESILEQSYTDYEVIVADAHSTDKTAETAQRYGCRVVSGGTPARGRNEGARHAKGLYILFLDADVRLEKTYLSELLKRVYQRKLDVVSGFITPDSHRLLDRFLVTGSNWYCFFIQKWSPHGSGFYILTTKSLHLSIGGFREDLFLGEDHDYLRRASRQGKFAYLTQPRVIFSMRRFDKEGRGNLVWKYFVLELYKAFKKDIKRKIVPYDFGHF